MVHSKKDKSGREILGSLIYDSIKQGNTQCPLKMKQTIRAGLITKINKVGWNGEKFLQLWQWAWCSPKHFVYLFLALEGLTGSAQGALPGSTRKWPQVVLRRPYMVLGNELGIYWMQSKYFKACIFQAL